MRHVFPALEPQFASATKVTVDMAKSALVRCSLVHLKLFLNMAYKFSFGVEFSVIDFNGACAIIQRVFVCNLKLLPLYYRSCLHCFSFGPSLTSARNQIQMAPARLKWYLLRSEDEHCVETNCSDA